jgi:thiazole synthase
MTGLTIAGRTFGSRLLVGTGKFSSNQAMAECLEASGTEIVTVALRRADLTGKDDLRGHPQLCRSQEISLAA